MLFRGVQHSISAHQNVAVSFFHYLLRQKDATPEERLVDSISFKTNKPVELNSVTGFGISDF